MTRRSIIRGFFIGLLALCISGWVASFYQASWLSYVGTATAWNAMCNSGCIHLSWVHFWDYPESGATFPGDRTVKHDALSNGWHLKTLPSVNVVDSQFFEHSAEPHHFGFGLYHLWDFGYRGTFSGWSLLVPFWFPTITSAGLLWLTWRKTRLPVTGQATTMGSAEQCDKPMKRWILRSVCIGLVFLFVAEWAIGAIACIGIGYRNRTCVRGCAIYWGTIEFTSNPSIGLSDEQSWSWGIQRLGHYMFWPSADRYRHSCFGFGLSHDPDYWWIGIPIWFPTLLSAVLLWWVWRKTRSKTDPKTAFPVEAQISKSE